MTQKEVIKTIKQLKQIKPEPEWVVFTKNQLLGEEGGQESFVRTLFSGWLNLFFQYKPAFAGLIVLLLIGIFAFAQGSLPGELLYPLKKASERGEAIFVAPAEMPKYNLKIANKRLRELTKIVQKEEQKQESKKQEVKSSLAESKAGPENLQPVINEFQARVAIAAQDLAQMGATTSSDPVMIKKIVEETKKLEENKQKIERLGVKVGETEQLDQTLALMVAREIKTLESKSLTEEEEQALVEIKEAYQAGNYSGALEKILLLSYPQEK